MLTILLRTVIIYIILISTMRIMGKRQIGELEVSDLVTTLLLSEIATLPIENQEIPVMYAVIPIITLLTIEVISSVISFKSPKIRGFLNAKPSILISQGKINQRELRNSRIAIDELISEIRLNGISDIKEVQYAILESSGKLTVIPKIQFSQPKMQDLKVKAEETGLAHIIISNGTVNDYNLNYLGKSRTWLDSVLKKHNTVANDVFLMTANDKSETNIVKKAKAIK
ncbi:MAG: hypothetical protein BHV88_01160 [Clostridiales bacterium 41_12_two_minus]|nr:MAG: hypothetical protein BHV88_01160 [Clostridiales bacterium 41_12_two_minus]